MVRTLHRLSSRTVASLNRPGLQADGGGLYLRIARGGSKGWIFRFTRNGRTRDAGLGSYPSISLAKAREQAEQFRRLLADGIDPIDARKAQQEEERRQASKSKTFEQCASWCIESLEAGWKNEKHRSQWRSTLKAYAFPIFGSLPVDKVGTEQVLHVLKPIWEEKPETASRVRQRIERVLNWAKAHGFREGENPARWRGHLDQLLPTKSKVRRVEHHAALEFRNIPGFMAELRAQQGNAARALEFLILTAARTGEVLGARWDEIDLEGGLWTVPAQRMKAGKEHRVPLSPRARAILRDMARQEENDFVFPGANPGRGLSTMSLLMLLRRLGRGDVTAHGFRSAFRDWASEATQFEREAAELALAHAIGNATEAAYRRGDQLEKRRHMMNAWGEFCGADPAPAKIIRLR